MKRKPSYPRVYFASDATRIKIGVTSKAVSDRMSQINAHLPRPLDVIGFVEGGMPLERAIQKRLTPWRIRGEWFRDCPEVRKIIDDILVRGAAAIGYRGDLFLLEHQQIAKSPKRIPPHVIGLARERFSKFGRVAMVLWPHKPALCLAQLTGLSERAAQYLITGKRKPSARAAIALLSEILDAPQGAAASSTRRGLP